MMAHTRESGSTRRAALQIGFGAAAATATWSPLLAATDPRPNIVFIMADDMGYADASCYGSRYIKTPAIDSIAAHGVMLTQGYANSAVCSATRTALITGRYQYRLPIGLEEPLAATTKHQPGLPPAHPTLPSLLKAAGYQTGLVGKWHLGRLPAYGPLQSGYDEFYGFRGGGVDYFSYMNTSGEQDLWRNDTDIAKSTDGYLTTLLGDSAVDFVDRRAGSTPFFLSLHFNAPHWPWEGPEDANESARIGKRIHHDDGGSQATYKAMIEAMDRQIARVLDALRRRGIRDNTIVVFTSDNGGERFADTWPFSGQKTELLEGGIRVPTLFSWPRRIAGGKASQQVAISMDWMPTLLAAAGAKPDPRYPSDGMNLLPQLSGAAPVPRTLFWRYKGNNQRAVREGNLKYLKIRQNTYLFDVAADPLERANLKERRPEDFARLTEKWRAWNATMLPEIAESFTDAVQASKQADHIGADRPVTTPDLDP